MTLDVRQLKAAGHGAAEVREFLRKLEARPVLTAHPTEATRRTLLDAAGAPRRRAAQRREHAPSRERAQLEEMIEAEIELLWLTDEVRRDRPSVLDEVSSVIWYLEDRLIEATSQVNTSARARVPRGLRRRARRQRSSMALGSWVGGDRDGNPFVTPEITLAATRRTSYALLD